MSDAGTELDLEGRGVYRCRIDVDAQEAQPLNHPLNPALIVIGIENQNRLFGEFASTGKFPRTVPEIDRPETPAAIISQDHTPAVTQIREFLRV